MTKEALKLALEVLEEGVQGTRPLGVATLEAIATIKEALAQPEQEPVAAVNDWSNWRDMVVVNIMRHGNINKHLARKLANHFQKAIPQRKPLTDEEIYSITGVENRDEMMHRMARNIARAIEAAHGIKGEA